VVWFKSFFGTALGIDLGTANTLIYVHDKGVVLREPSVVAVDENTNLVRWVGEEARAMIGRTPQGIRAIRPLKDGVVADLEYAKIMLKKFVERVTGSGGIKNPDMAIGVPSGVTSVERIAIKSVAENARAAIDAASRGSGSATADPPPISRSRYIAALSRPVTRFAYDTSAYRWSRTAFEPTGAGDRR